MFNDPIADMLTRIRNASKERHKYVDIFFSKHVLAILSVFKENGFIYSFLTSTDGRTIRVNLKYEEGRLPLIKGLRRVSTPGRRIYVGWTDVPVIRKGLGLSIISTSKGVMDGIQARKEKVGGELICTVW